METKVVGKITFDNKQLDVYSSLDEPLFRAQDVAEMLDYSEGNTWNLLELCEDDEKMQFSMTIGGQKRWANFITESGLYNILF